MIDLSIIVPNREIYYRIINVGVSIYHNEIDYKYAIFNYLFNLYIIP